MKKLTKKDFNKILENYNLGNYTYHKYIFTGGNLVYKLRTNKGFFILKVYKNANLKFVESQINLLEFLSKTEVSVPKIILNKNKKGLTIYDKEKIAIQEFAKGKGVQYLNEKLSEDLGKKLGILNKTLKKYTGRFYTKEGENQYKKLTFPLKYPEVKNIKKEYDKVFEEIQKINKNNLKRGLVHGDICEGNFLVKDNKVSAIIDFDDTHITDFAWEISIPIAQNLTTRKNLKKNLVKVFLREYQKIIKLNHEEKKSLYLFAKYRLLDGVAWCYGLIQEHPKEKKELMKWIEINMDKYRVLDEISLEDWMKIVK
jgi:Ser/Thr protein kinase RdoA (MazF antagonist)